MTRTLYSGTRLQSNKTIDIDTITDEFFAKKPNMSISQQCVKFGTSGHRGKTGNTSFTLDHVVAITQAIVDYRKQAGITGPIFVGKDTHLLSELSFQAVLSVLIKGGCVVHIDMYSSHTPTPAVSRAIIRHNRVNNEHADGILITPSHNPPEDGGIKYNPPHGGPAGAEATSFIEQRANELLENDFEPTKYMMQEKPYTSPLLKPVDICVAYVEDLARAIDIEAIKKSGVRIAVDPMGGAACHYWQVIKNVYGLNIKIVNPVTDPLFSFIPPDEDGVIRMDCSSRFSMQNLISFMENAEHDVGVANDPDGDRHGIVLPGDGLVSPNLFLAIAAKYLIKHRPDWPTSSGIGKTVVTSDLLSKVADEHDYFVDDTPVGFKWFVERLHNGELMFSGEESSGGAFAEMDGACWTTDKDGILLCLLAAEIIAKTGMTPIEYGKSEGLVSPNYIRKTYPISADKMALLKAIAPSMFYNKTIAGGTVIDAFSEAPSKQGGAIGGVKVRLDNGWFAIRPSGTEPVYKIYAESSLNTSHSEQLIKEVSKMIESPSFLCD
jgi:phosphoglucomutase|tara:strand:+ start:3938 stop:5587 length:1650 start_codon:yes stop_codon:yes gene_type:complete